MRYDVITCSFAIIFTRKMADTRLYDLLGVQPNASDVEIKKVRPFNKYSSLVLFFVFTYDLILGQNSYEKAM